MHVMSMCTRYTTVELKLHGATVGLRACAFSSSGQGKFEVVSCFFLIIQKYFYVCYCGEILADQSRLLQYTHTLVQTVAPYNFNWTAPKTLYITITRLTSLKTFSKSEFFFSGGNNG